MASKRLTITDVMEFVKAHTDKMAATQVTKVRSKSSHALGLGKLSNTISFGPEMGKLFKNYDLSRLGTLCPESENDTLLCCLLQAFDIDVKHLDDTYDSLLSGLKKNKFDEFGYKFLGWTKKQMIEVVSSRSQSKKMMMKYLADYLHINLFVIDGPDDCIYFVGGEHYIRYKKHVLVLKNSEHYELLCTDTGKYFTHRDNVVKNLIKHKDKIEVLLPQQDSVLQEYDEDLEKYANIAPIPATEEGDDINRFSESESEDPEPKTKGCVYLTDQCEPVGSDSEESDSEESESDAITKNTLLAKKLSELMSMASAKGIDLYHKVDGKRKKKTKPILIEDLLKKI